MLMLQVIGTQLFFVFFFVPFVLFFFLFSQNGGPRFGGFEREAKRKQATWVPYFEKHVLPSRKSRVQLGRLGHVSLD